MKDRETSGERVNSERAPVSETGARVDAAAEWRSAGAAWAGCLLLYLSLSGFAVYLLPFGDFTQFTIVVHTVVGLISLLPIAWYVYRHWGVRRKGNLSHYQLLGYIAAFLLLVCVVSGLVVTWQGVVGPRMSYAWDLVHLLTGAGMALFLVVHLATVVVRKVKNPDALRVLRGARRSFYARSVVGTVFLLLVGAVWAVMYRPPSFENRPFDAAYSWRFGADRPFAPSLSRLDDEAWRGDVQRKVSALLREPARVQFVNAMAKRQERTVGPLEHVRACTSGLDLTADETAQLEAILSEAALHVQSYGAIDPRALTGSAGCGTSGCHHEIYEEWLPSAHRYSAMDDLFQQVQSLMVDETSSESTRYCAGCHDPISLFSGSKTDSNVTLSAEGADEGASCLVCHSIVQTDVQGNGDYTMRVPDRYAYETSDSGAARFLAEFLIRTYPRHHVEEYARPLYKTAEFCGACHKQYVDTEVNTDIGKVQGQNQYDSWKNSRWYHEGNPDRTVECRECHMPLVPSIDPARGDVVDRNRTADDGKHRSHRSLASNQYVPLLHDLPGAAKHIELTEQWLRGEYEIPEIAHKWVSGPVVRMEVIAPAEVRPGERAELRVMLVNNKTGHDFPTGPLDMIESWVELTVTDDEGQTVYQAGVLDESGHVVESPLVFKADGFDREGELIDRHNLWDLVGASYKRAIYPGMSDTATVEFQCPSMARGRLKRGSERIEPGRRVDAFDLAVPDDAIGTLRVSAVLKYRKANPEFLDRVYGTERPMRSPVTDMTRAEAIITVLNDEQANAQ